MQVIDLLNKKANGEELPSEINCYNQAFYLSDGIYIAKNQVGKYFEDYFDFSSLDYEVEIVEDTPKEDKKIEDKARFQYSQIPSWFDMKEFIRVVNENFERHQKALNEIIDYINKGSEK